MNDIDFRQRLGKMLHKIRTDQGVSQERLAQIVYSHRNYIGRIERGEQTPTIIFCYKVAKALNTSLSKIITDLEEEINNHKSKK